MSKYIFSSYIGCLSIVTFSILFTIMILTIKTFLQSFTTCLFPTSLSPYSTKARTLSLSNKIRQSLFSLIIRQSILFTCRQILPSRIRISTCLWPRTRLFWKQSHVLSSTMSTSRTWLSVRPISPRMIKVSYILYENISVPL